MKKILIILLSIIPFSLQGQSLIIPDILKGDIVLQQNTNAGIWGKAKPGANVTVTSSWDNKTYNTKAAADSLWKVKVATPSASYTPYTITIVSAKETISLENILIGDVWLCGGQSNMEMPMKGMFNCYVEGAVEDIAMSGLNKGLRFVTVQKNQATSSQPGVFTKGSWVKSGPGTTADFSATGYHFGSTLHQALDIPIGLISCNWSGSFVEDWFSAELLEQYPDQKVFGNERTKAFTKMYYGMLEPTFNYAVKGMIWYQGESNVGSPDYHKRLAAAVAHWKSRFGNESFPFYLVELAPYPYNQGYEEQCPAFRMLQLKAATEEIPEGGMVSTYDLAYEHELVANQIHPARKKEVGQRLAYLALSKAYGFGNPAEGPVYEDMSVSNGTITVFFKNSANGFMNFGTIEGFEVAGEDKVFHPAKATIGFGRRSGSPAPQRGGGMFGGGYAVRVSCDEVPNPVAVRYAYKDFARGNLYNTEGIPAVPFRSDNW